MNISQAQDMLDRVRYIETSPVLSIENKLKVIANYGQTIKNAMAAMRTHRYAVADVRLVKTYKGGTACAKDGFSVGYDARKFGHIWILVHGKKGGGIGAFGDAVNGRHLVNNENNPAVVKQILEWGSINVSYVKKIHVLCCYGTDNKPFCLFDHVQVKFSNNTHRVSATAIIPHKTERNRQLWISEVPNSDDYEILSEIRDIMRNVYRRVRSLQKRRRVQ